MSDTNSTTSPPNPQRSVASSTPPIFDTGDDRLDAFMRRSWKPSDRKAAAKRVGRGLRGPSPLSSRQLTKAEVETLHAFNSAAVAAWANLGFTVTMTGDAIKPSGSNVRVAKS